MTTPSKPTNPHPHILYILPSTLTATTRTIAHLTRLLSKTAHLDSFLLTSTYTLHLLHALLARSPHTARLRLTTSLSPLTALLDEYRTLLRLFGLLNIYNLAAKTYLSPLPAERDARIIRAVTWAQIVSIATFQALENGAFLAGRGVLGWSGERVGRAYKWSARAWMGYVGLEFLKLGVEGGRARREIREAEKEGVLVGGGEGEGEKERGVVLREEKEGREQRWNEVWRRFCVNSAYAPMTVHYSMENGPLSEGSTAALGVVVASLTFGKVWRESA